MKKGLITGFWTGFWAPLHAFRFLLKSPSVATLVLIPLAINLALYALFFYYGANYFDGLITGWIADLSATLPGWLVTISKWSLKILSWLILGMVAAISFTIVSGIVSAPFNDHLSRAALRLRLRELGVPQSAIPSTDLTVMQTVRLEMKRLVILIAGAICALILGIIPLMQIPALMLGAWIVSFEYFGYPISQRSSRLGPVFTFTLRHPAISLGFGSFLLLIMALPFTSVLYIPLAVIGGTKLYADLTTNTTSLPGAPTRKRT